MTGYLLDENLPAHVNLPTALPIEHARDRGPSQSDTELWDYAASLDLVIVSKDADFSERILRLEPPPKIVHLRFGNLRLAAFREHLERVWPRVETLLHSHKLVNVYLDRLEAVA